MFPKFITALLLILNLAGIMAHAQPERTDDLVPYKKAGKWGLVHHNGKEFYPAVFDSLLYERQYGTLTLFRPGDARDTVLPVRYKKQSYFFTPDKQLISSTAYQQKIKKLPKLKFEVLMEEENTPVTTGGSSIKKDTVLPNTTGIRKINDSLTEFRTVSGKTVLVKEERQPNGSWLCKFYINGKYIPEFDCDGFRYSRQEEKKGAFIGLIVSKRSQTGYLNFETETVALPMQYSFLLDYSMQWENWLIDPREGKILTKEGKQVGREFRWLKGLGLSYKADPREVIVEVKRGEYQFYYPEKDSLGAEVYDELWEYGCGDTAFSTNEPYYKSVKNNKKGVFTLSGKTVIPFEYDDIRCFSQRFIQLEKDNKFGFIDIVNKWLLIPTVYDKLSEPVLSSFDVNGLPCYLFFAERKGQPFYVDNFGKEFISK